MSKDFRVRDIPSAIVAETRRGGNQEDTRRFRNSISLLNFVALTERGAANTAFPVEAIENPK